MVKKITQRECDSMTSFLLKMRKPGQSAADVAMQMAKEAGATKRELLEMERMYNELRAQGHEHTKPLEG